MEFCRALSHVRVGMTQQQASQAIGAYEARLLKSADYLGYSHSDDGAYNADFGSIQLQDGRVTSVSFSPD